jgi:prepilin-type N-terminal cleavage/methylation domain-containing protein
MWAQHQTQTDKKIDQHGFTIVELLIVIVVIGILAAIIIVAYNGMQQRARTSAVMADLTNSAKKMAIDNVNNGSYALTEAAVDGGKGLPTSSGTTYQYHSTGSTYCVTGTNGNVSYKISDTAAAPSQGGCAGDGQGGVAAITNLATNPSAESVTTGFGYWSAGGTATFTRPSTGGYSGTSFMRMVFTAASTSGSGGMYYGNSPEAVQVGTTYSLSGSVRTSVSKTMKACIEWYSSTPALMGTSCSANVTTTANVWTLLTATGQAPTGTAWARITFYASGPIWSIGDTLDVDAIMLVQGASSPNYADGNTSSWIWNGTTNNSTSTGPPQ